LLNSLLSQIQKYNLYALKSTITEGFKERKTSYIAPVLPLLRLHNLSIGFTTPLHPIRVATHGINLSLERGEILGIIGESGSGKSVTFLSLMGLLPKSANKEGAAFYSPDGVNELDLFSLKPRPLRKLALKEIAYIFQDPLAALNPSLKIGTQMNECVLSKQNAQKTKEIILHALEEVLPGAAERIYQSWPHSLSGGQRQRVMIAMAMLNQPKLLIADEPTTALDPQVQKNILDLLAQKVKQNKSTCVLVSHDIQSIAPYCHRIAVFYKGQIVEVAPTERLLNNPSSPYTKALLNCRPKSENKGFFLPTVEDYLKTPAPVFHPYPPHTYTNEVLLEAKNVSKTYQNKFQALTSVNINLKKGECVGIIGESGSGKSSLAKLIVDLESPNMGSIEKAKTLNKASIQMVFQDPYASLNPSISIGKALEEVVSLYSPTLNPVERKKWTLSLLAETGITGDVLHKKPAAFSGGQRQRIAIARALAAKPEVLVCDEAVSALDISVQAQVLNLLKKLQIEKNLSLLFITHDMQIARHICNRIIVLKNGEIIEEGETESLFNSPKEAYTKELVAHYKID
jgi:peptide/nickel transport system ATP-binding protein